MLNIGCHLSSSGGFLAMGKQALEIGANTFQFFTRNPRGGSAKPFDKADALALAAFLSDNSFSGILAHAPYTMNCAARDISLRSFCIATMTDDLYRISHIPNAMYNLHPGSHTGQGREKGLELIAEVLNTVVTDKQGPLVLLETMAGKGTELGGTFEDLRDIISLLNIKSRFKVCLDTCHVFDTGYNIADDLQSVLNSFDTIIGLNLLKAVHLNDSVHGHLSHKDRHAKIGEGKIGFDAFERIINHPSLKSLPFYLETPNEINGYKNEISLLKKAYKE